MFEFPFGMPLGGNLAPGPGPDFRTPTFVDQLQGANYGFDVSTLNGLDPAFGLIGGPRAVAERLIRLVTTPRGSLAFYPNRCLDVRDWVRKRATQKDLQHFKAMVQAEWLKDEEVLAANVSVTYQPASQMLVFTGDIVLATGPFQLVLAVTAVTVELLSLSNR